MWGAIRITAAFFPLHSITAARRVLEGLSGEDGAMKKSDLKAGVVFPILIALLAAGVAQPAFARAYGSGAYGNGTYGADTVPPVISSFTLLKDPATITLGSSLTSSDFSCVATDESGEDVTIAITGLDTSSLGDHTATCTATDTSNNTATSTLTYEVLPGVSAGGGGAPAPSASQTFLNVQPGTTATMTITNTAVGILSVSFRTTEVASGKITATSSAAPAAAPAPSSKVYKYVEIESTFPPGTLTDIKVSFAVTKAWLTANNIAPNEVRLGRLVNGAWQIFVPLVTRETADGYVFEASIPGLSRFAIFGAEKPAPPPSPPPAAAVCGNGIIESGEKCDGTSLGGATCESVLGPGYTGTLSCKSDCTFETSGCEAPAPPPGPPTPPPPGPAFPISSLGLAIAVVIAVIVVAHTLRRHGKRITHAGHRHRIQWALKDDSSQG